MSHAHPVCSGCGGCSRQSAQDRPAPPANRPLHHPPMPLFKAAVDAPCFHHAHLLLAAGCCAFSCADFHQRFLRHRVPLIACASREDAASCAEKLLGILSRNAVLTVTVVRMEHGCCDGMEAAARQALRDAGKFIPWQVITLTADGRVAEP